MLPISINTLCCKDDVKYLMGYLQFIPLGCEVNLLYTEGCDTVKAEITEMQQLFVNIDHKDEPVISRQKDEVGGELKIYKLTYPKINGVDKFSFSEAKNALNRLATREWIVNLDVDERIVIESDEIATLINMPKEIGGVTVSIISYTLPQKNANGGIYANQAMRIFRNHPKISYRYRVHEDILSSIINQGFKIANSTITIKHRGYEGHDPNILIDKTYRNLGYLATDLQFEPRNKYLLGYVKKSVDKLAMMGEI